MQYGIHWADRREELGEQVSDVAWRMELEPIRRAIAVFGQSIFRGIPPRYRRTEMEPNSFSPEHIHEFDARVLMLEGEMTIISNGAGQTCAPAIPSR